jgi:hexokinase
MEGSFHFLALERLTDRFSLVQPSLVEFYPRFETIMRETLRALVGSEVESHVDIGLAKDGSGAGGKPV